MISLATADRVMGVVLVGTHPWANSAFDRLLPRTLLPVAQRPLVSYALSWLVDGGVSQAAVCANRETQVLQSRLHRHVPTGMAVSYHEDVMPRGAAGALRDAALASDYDTFIVTDGTSIPNVELNDLLAHHVTSRAAVTILVHRERERPGSPCAHVPTGMYVCNRDALLDVPERGFYDLKESLIPQLYRTGRRVSAFAAESVSPRVHDATSYLAVNGWMVEQLLQRGDVPDDYVKFGTCLHHREVAISDDVEFVGPVLVGQGARLGSRAVVVGPTSIGSDAVVGEGALVSRSAIWRRSVIGDLAVADRCVLADDTIMDPHAQAFGAVMFTHFNQEPQESRAASADGLAGAPDSLGRVSGFATSADWSRHPAAQ
jgi:NDP-sugar pyrophosphorylase family protein